MWKGCQMILPDVEPNPPQNNGTGVLPAQALRRLIATGAIAANPPVDPAQIQPASLDLRLGLNAYRVRASFLAGANRTVAERLAEFTMHEVDQIGRAHV